MDKKRKAYIESCEVSYTEKVELGGYTQTIAVEGRSKTLPIVIFLHGGPGLPMPFSVGCRGMFPDITDKFIMVYWDQLGCGINNRPIDSSFTVESFNAMTADLVKHIKSRFPENKLYLFGMSWGSVLSLYAAAEVPDLLDGVISYGQILSAPMFSEEAFDAIERSHAPEKHKKIARSLRASDNKTFDDGMRLSKIIRKYTDGYNNRNSKPAPIKPIIKGLMTSPDYKFKDIQAIVSNGYKKNRTLMTEVAEIDYSAILKKISVPYMIFQGDTDIVTSTKNVTKTVDECGNNFIAYSVLQDNGHFPSQDAMYKVFDYIEKIQ